MKRNSESHSENRIVENLRYDFLGIRNLSLKSFSIGLSKISIKKLLVKVLISRENYTIPNITTVKAV